MEVSFTVTREYPGLKEDIKAALGRVKQEEGRTAADVASDAGMGRANLYAILSGRVKSCPYETIRRVEKALGMDSRVQPDAIAMGADTDSEDNSGDADNEVDSR